MSECEGYRRSTAAAPPCSGRSSSAESWPASGADERRFSPLPQKTVKQSHMTSLTLQSSLLNVQYLHGMVTVQLFKWINFLTMLCIHVISFLDAVNF